ncbi:MAG TPA: hypothetical protein VGO78_18825 [Acidimicrobiales bacterium]|jgi:hypothetical protein|nr:hypothetical protein [Acidimicrobiales bacterium]
MSLTIDEVVKAARSGFVTTVGLGALAYQQAQVQRQALNRSLPRLLHELGEAVDDRLATLGERLCDADERADNIFDGIEQRLPAPVRSAARQVHTLARDVRAQVPPLLSNDHEVSDTA